jgi:hypothetical protein
LTNELIENIGVRPGKKRKEYPELMAGAGAGQSPFPTALYFFWLLKTKRR